ncbi:hypothetical protein BT96DRAFT_364279 [Gymnopus androsaceus JB14]|uniref:Uncharacterized protein n=1 Tax=Gymnopus androsaceus JB14 TaxID=1447944 RepID=A0A6A4GWY5_9AGAR|nr:hypothetical protein BT96DRAFT_364279 [Gymnopus androsaceus JB14]
MTGELAFEDVRVGPCEGPGEVRWSSGLSSSSSVPVIMVRILFLKTIYYTYHFLLASLYFFEIRQILRFVSIFFIGLDLEEVPDSFRCFMMGVEIVE